MRGLFAQPGFVREDQIQPSSATIRNRLAPKTATRYTYLASETYNAFGTYERLTTSTERKNRMDISLVESRLILEPFPIMLIVFTLIVLFVILAAIIILTAVIWCRLFSKAGHHWTLGLLMLVPIANVIMPFVLAFGGWPIEKELQQLRRQLSKSST